MPITPEQFEQMQIRLHGKNRPAPVPTTSDQVEYESDLHHQILDYCGSKGWIALHGSTATKTHRTIGESDFCCLLPNREVLFVECKRKGGKLSVEQQAMSAWMQKLGHEMHVVHSLQEFQTISNGKLQSHNSSENISEG